MLTDAPPVFDRSPQRQKFVIDLQTATTSAWQSGVELPDIVLSLLERADELSAIAADTGVDMSKLSGILDQ
jgi:hypothetical protein